MLARPCTRIRTKRVDPAELSPTQSRFGGLPHMPVDLDWPMHQGEPLAHVATLKLSELAPFDSEHLLPPRGLLYFWYIPGDGPWGYDPKDRTSFRVDIVRDESCLLEQRPLPRNLLSKDRAESMPTEGAYRSCTLSFEPTVSVPSSGSIRLCHPRFHYLAELQEYFDLTLALSIQDTPMHQLLGWPTELQESMELDCQLVTHGFFCGGLRDDNDRRIRALTPGACQWRQVLQIDSDDAPDWMWGDCGRIYYWMPLPALLAANFDRVWMILQCY